MTKDDWYYFHMFPYQLEDMVDAFLFTDEVDLSTDEVARDIKDRLHTLRWEIHQWIRNQEVDE